VSAHDPAGGVGSAGGAPRQAPATWWLPRAAREPWRGLPQRTLRVGAPGDTLSFTFPDPGRPEIEALLAHLSRAGDRLAHRPLADVLRSLDALGHALADPGDARRAAALDLVAAATGRARAMCADSLDFLLSKLELRALAATVRAAAAEPACLSTVAAHPAGRRRRAVGPRLTVHLLAGNTPWAGAESLIAALCARSASLVKLSSREPALAGLLAQALADVDPELAEAVAVVYWPRGAQVLEEVAFAEADAVVAFGDNDTVRGLAERLAWRSVSGRLLFVPRAHRTAVALVGTGARADHDTARRTAEALARDFALEDQEGCLSPHGAYVEAGGAGSAQDAAATPGPAVSVDEFANLVAEALAARERDWPRRLATAAEAAAVQQARGAAELRGARVLAPPGSTRWTVVVDPRPLFEPTPLGRYAWLKPVADLDAALAALLPARGLLSTVGVAGLEGREADWIGKIAEALVPGRICPAGEMQRPPAGWNHDGASDLAALLRWVEVEEPGEIPAEDSEFEELRAILDELRDV